MTLIIGQTLWKWDIQHNQNLEVKGYAFLSFARKLGDKYGEKLMDTPTKTVIDPTKTTWKRVVQKKAEAPCNLIGNKIANKITSVGKSKEKAKKSKINLHSTRKKTTNYWWLKIVLSVKCKSIL